MNVRRITEWAAIAGAAAAMSALGLKVVRLVDGPAGVAAFLAAAPLGYVCADLASGLAHWLADRFGSPDTPLLGRAFIQPFREHHVDPLGITRHSFAEVNGNNCIVLLPLAAGAAWIAPAGPAGWPWVLGFAWTFWMYLALVATNQIHKWAHLPSPPPLVRAFQRRRLILSPEHHAIHHTAPHETHYCITAGWLNGWLERWRFFPLAERLLGRPVTSPPSPDA